MVYKCLQSSPNMAIFCNKWNKRRHSTYTESRSRIYLFSINVCKREKIISYSEIVRNFVHARCVCLVVWSEVFWNCTNSGADWNSFLFYFRISIITKHAKTHTQRLSIEHRQKRSLSRVRHGQRMKEIVCALPMPQTQSHQHRLLIFFFSSSGDWPIDDDEF